MNATLTQARLKELLHYDPETGAFTWRVRRGGPATPGSRAGSVTYKGYLYIGIDNERHMAHRLAWLYMTGAWPGDQIDHRDTNKMNNRFANLRLATNSFNGQNRTRAHTGSATGVLGVGVRRGRFIARIRVCGKTVHIGCFSTAEAAHAAYVQAKRELHPGNTL